MNQTIQKLIEVIRMKKDGMNQVSEVTFWHGWINPFTTICEESENCVILRFEFTC